MSRARQSWTWSTLRSEVRIDFSGRSYATYLYLNPGQTSKVRFAGRLGFLDEPGKAVLDLVHPQIGGKDRLLGAKLRHLLVLESWSDQQSPLCRTAGFSR